MTEFAFLFYAGDYLRDTQCLSEKAQVAYDRVMCEHMRNICITQKQLNFFTKRLSEDEKEELLSVLVADNEGYYIEWVVSSIRKRQAYSDSRRSNRLKNTSSTQKNTSVTYDIHMEKEIENEKEIVKELERVTENGGKKNQKDVAIRAMVLDLCPQFDNSDFFMAWADWEQVRREKKRPITYTAAKLALKKLSGYDLPTVIQALQNSASNSWQGVFPEKTDRPMPKPQIYEQMEATYRQFYQSKSGELYPKFNTAEQKELVSIIDKLTQMCEPKGTKPTEAWEYILNNFGLLEDFYRKQVQIADINKNFGNIINQIRQNTKGSVSQNSAADYSFDPSKL